MFVPVVDKDQNPLMPTKPSRARRWIREGKATPFWKNGLFCVRLNVEPSDRNTQDIAVGVDPGSKKEGFTVKSEAHTYLNVQADAHTHTKKKIETRRNLRRGRRTRNCPNRKNRTNRLANKVRIPPSTRSRWGWKLRILDWLDEMFPITQVCVEDIKAKTMPRARRWNSSFSPAGLAKFCCSNNKTLRDIWLCKYRLPNLVTSWQRLVLWRDTQAVAVVYTARLRNQSHPRSVRSKKVSEKCGFAH